MIIASIILMVLGVAVFAAGFAFPKKGATAPVTFEKPQEEEEIVFSPIKTTPIVENTNKNQGKNKNKKEAAAPTEAVNAIEAAKRKAKEAVNQDYSFDLHLTDSSNQTVEELERDLLSGLEIAEGEGEAADAEAAQPKTNNQNKSNRSNKKGGKKKNTPVNDRYDDLLFEDTPAEPVKETESGNANNGNNGNKNNNGNGNNGGNKQGNNNSRNKKGKKK
jgi:hypothetical protein